MKAEVFQLQNVGSKVELVRIGDIVSSGKIDPEMAWHLANWSCWYNLGNNYTLYVERVFHIHGEIDLQSNLKDMEKVRVCNTEFFPYIMETYHIPTNKGEVEEIELPF